MANFIQEFFYGNIEPQARGIRDGGEAKRQSEVLSRCEAELLENLTGGDLKLFQEYMKAQAGVLELTDLDSFIAGFRLGARFCYDTFVSDDRPYYDISGGS